MQDLFQEGITFDDILLQPRYSEILPSQVDLQGRFSRNIKLNRPLVSAAMDTVTEASAAIVMAQEGGIGVIHKNMSIEDQAFEIRKVKKYEAGMIVEPISVGPENTLQDVLELAREYKISGFPVVDAQGKLVGIITNRDLRFQSNADLPVSSVMTKEHLVTAPEGTTPEQAKEILYKHRIEKLPVIDGEGHLVGLITIKDIEKPILFPYANKDHLGRLRVAAAISTGEEELQRAEALVQAHVDALVIDTAHGDSLRVVEMLKEVKKRYPQVDVVAGNIATREGCEHLIAAGADAVKVGIGPGSICTTRVVAGIGVPQVTALLNVKEVCEKHGVPYISDGGIKYSGDVVKALACGAGAVMIGSLFAGTDESPGETVLYQGRSYKVYRGMGSLGAMKKGSKDRYGQKDVEEVSKFVPEGIEGKVPYRGSLSSNIYQLTGGIRSGMGYVGANNLSELVARARFVKITSASLKESHPHDVVITKEAPNYRLS